MPDVGRLVQEAQRDLARRRWEGLVLEHRHLQTCTDVPSQHGVLAADRKIAARRGDLLLCSRDAGGMGIGAGENWNVRADGAETDVVENSRGTLGGVLVDVQCRRIGRDVDDADLRDWTDTRYALATGEACGQQHKRQAKRSAGRIGDW